MLHADAADAAPPAVTETANHNQGVYFVMIDDRGAYYTATQAGAFVSTDRGKSWTAYHVVMTSRAGKTIDRVPHDYQVPCRRQPVLTLPLAPHD